MAYDDTSTGDAIADAVKTAAASVPVDEAITDAQLKAIWSAAEGAFKGTGIPTLAVSSSGATAAHGLGAPATITALPGTVT